MIELTATWNPNEDTPDAYSVSRGMTDGIEAVLRLRVMSINPSVTSGAGKVEDYPYFLNDAISDQLLSFWGPRFGDPEVSRKLDHGRS
jgi:hypothetical protein